MYDVCVHASSGVSKTPPLNEILARASVRSFFSAASHAGCASRVVGPPASHDPHLAITWTDRRESANTALGEPRRIFRGPIRYTRDSVRVRDLKELMTRLMTDNTITDMWQSVHCALICCALHSCCGCGSPSLLSLLSLLSLPSLPNALCSSARVRTSELRTGLSLLTEPCRAAVSCCLLCPSPAAWCGPCTARPTRSWSVRICTAPRCTQRCLSSSPCSRTRSSRRWP